MDMICMVGIMCMKLGRLNKKRNKGMNKRVWEEQS